uniref:O-acyltransferase n=1 Tax=Pseudonaja textilis TaxID=8673 RepID=A0A670ZN44_PSETE
LLDKTLEEAAHSRPHDVQLPISPNIYYLLAGNLSLFYSTLLEVEHFRTIHHIFVAVLCIFVLKQIIVDSIEEGRFVLDFEIFIAGFRQLPTALFACLCMFLYTLFVPYQALQIWSGCLKMTRFPNLLTVTLVVVLLLCHAAVLGFFPIYIVVYSNLGIGSRKIVLYEQIRFLMKSYSFLRESMPPLLHATDQISPPELSTYLYFLFCPTLIYRKSYPSFKNLFSLPKVGRTNVFLYLSHSVISILFVVFYFFMDCWQNIFAEILRFADRSFYKDWWNSTAFSTFFRSWNVIVHDWLYYYIYQDFLWLIGERARAGAMLIVFLLSAISHEYILTFSFGFFYPVFFVIYTYLLDYKMHEEQRKGPVWNTIIWICLPLGLGIFLSLYCQEWFAHVHCPLKEKTFWELVTPRSWYCHP